MKSWLFSQVLGQGEVRVGRDCCGLPPGSLGAAPGVFVCLHWFVSILYAILFYIMAVLHAEFWFYDGQPYKYFKIFGGRWAVLKYDKINKTTKVTDFPHIWGGYFCFSTKVGRLQ